MADDYANKPNLLGAGRREPERDSVGRRPRLAALLAITLGVVPLVSVPLYVLGHRAARAVDNDVSDGLFALDLILGVGGPAALAIVIASRRVRVAAAVGIGLASSALSVAVLVAALVTYCSGNDCFA